MSIRPSNERLDERLGPCFGGSYALLPTPRIGVVNEFDRANELTAEFVNLIAEATISEEGRYVRADPICAVAQLVRRLAFRALQASLTFPPMTVRGSCNRVSGGVAGSVSEHRWPRNK